MSFPTSMVRIDPATLEQRFPEPDEQSVGYGRQGTQSLPLLRLATESRPFLSALVGTSSSTTVDRSGRPRFLLAFVGEDGPLLEMSLGPQHRTWLWQARRGLLLQFADGVQEFLQPGQRWGIVAVEFNAAVLGGA